ncbi:hypothetical protein DFH08DRAFT_1080936 [Mycena albidolilacea]|uniref:F-box domain-containing protein n=1 Tax=Mycena albidolilacea TaxID=1033008 RepID=A0AAD7A1K8_9AGAR|nr:hypothetical protein DFH08DRAFT_1080936 [Mycena albidolilacea]
MSHRQDGVQDSWAHVSDELASALQKERSTFARLWLMIAPIGRLPTEALVEIFMQSVLKAELQESPPAPVQRFDAPKAVSNAARQALLISKVCPYWRQIATNTPQLWNVGVIDLQLARVHSSTIAYTVGLRALLERSLPLPISVSLSHGLGELTTVPGAVAHVAKTLLQTMVPTTSRWKSLKADSLMKYLSQLPEGAFHALESLDIRCAFSSRSQPIRTFLVAPRLQRLTLSISGYESRELILIPWNQLIHLKLTHPSLSDCLGILLRCARLVSAEFSTTEWEDLGHTGADAPPTLLPFLQTLNMRFNAGAEDVGHVEPFWKPLILPALHTLELEFDAGPGVFWSAPEFSAFQRRSPHIAHITLTNCPLTSAELITLLRLAPATTMLKLKCCKQCIDDEFLKALTCDAHSSLEPLAPRLQRLDCGFAGGLFSDEGFEVAIRSRWWTDSEERSFSRLDRASLSPYAVAARNRKLVARMKDLVEQGPNLTSFRQP